jgi:methylenetetrahydrofolate reductase (NADPH)
VSIFREKVIEGKEFIITCEFVPGRGSKGPAIDEIIKFGEKAISSGLPIHALSLTDNPGGNPAISPDFIAEELKSIGMESLVHVSCAGINRNTIESRVSGLARKGLENVLVVTGDYPDGGFHGKAKPVFDLDSTQTIKYMKEMNAGIEVPGGKGGEINRLPQTNFFLACAINPFGKDYAELATQFIKLEKKLQAGADLIIPNLGYNIRKFAEVKKYLLHRNINVPLFGNCYVLSRPVARIMNKGSIAGCVVSDELLKIMEEEAAAPDKGKKARLERAAQLTAFFRGMKWSGVHLGGFGLKFEDFEYIIRRSEELAGAWREFVPNFAFGQKRDGYFFPDDLDMTFAADKLVPLAQAINKKYSFNFSFSRLTHKAAFTKNTHGFALGKAVYTFLEKHKTLEKTAYFFERQIKRVLFNCQECGDCALFSTGYLCPMSQCVKFQRNGPCGGSKNGMCEGDPEKQCVWPRSYTRLAPVNALDSIKTYIPPVNYSLSKTSSWGNYFLGKDHEGEK